ncbi:MAG: hypothetical protein ACK4HB_07830 [Candidatus Bipolaricaulia bacterium]
MKRLHVALAALMLLILIGGSWALAQVFGIGPYGGGTLTAIYRLTNTENDPSPATRS